MSSSQEMAQRQRYGVQHQETTAHPAVALVPYGPQEHVGGARVHMQSHQGSTGVDKSPTKHKLYNRDIYILFFLQHIS
jgi:hypothetical protein